MERVFVEDDVVVVVVVGLEAARLTSSMEVAEVLTVFVFFRVDGGIDIIAEDGLDDGSKDL